MAAHITVKKTKKSLAAYRKKHEEKLLRMTKDELAKEMQATFDWVLNVVKKRS